MREIEDQLLDVPIKDIRDQQIGAIVPEGTNLAPMSPLNNINKLIKQ